MTWQELQNQALQLPIGDRWRLVQSLLLSIQQDTLLTNSPKGVKPVSDLDSWTQSLVGVIQLDAEEPNSASHHLINSLNSEPCPKYAESRTVGRATEGNGEPRASEDSETLCLEIVCYVIGTSTSSPEE